MQLSKQHLHLKFSAPLWRGVAAFWSWWSGELRGMLPPRVRRALMPRAQHLFLELDGTELVMSQGTAQNKAELTRYELDQAGETPLQLSAEDELQQRARELVLCLPEDKVLARSLTLPLAAEENLREVLSFEMDRQTPFTAEPVYSDFSIVARSSAERTLTVDLVLATRRMLDELLARLDQRGLHPDRVTINCGESGGFTAVNLLPAANRQRKAITPQLVNLALGALTLLLLVGAVSLPLLNKRQQIEALEPLLETLLAMGGQVEAISERVEAGEPVADLHVQFANLTGIDIPPELVPLAIDEFPAIFVAAACAEGPGRARLIEIAREAGGLSLEAGGVLLTPTGLPVDGPLLTAVGPELTLQAGANEQQRQSEDHDHVAHTRYLPRYAVVSEPDCRQPNSSVFLGGVRHMLSLSIRIPAP